MRGRVLVPKTFVILAIFLSVALFSGTGAWAFLDTSLTITRLHSEAERVVVGNVEKVWVEVGSWPNVDHEVPITHAQVRTDEILKGDPAAGLVTISVPGGEMPDGTVVRVSDTPEFIEGERILAFLVRPRRIGRTIVFGWSHGLFPVIQDDLGIERVLSPFNHNVFDGAPLDRIREVIQGEAADDLWIPVAHDFGDLEVARATAGCQWCGKHSDDVSDLWVNPNFSDSCAGSTSQQTAALQDGASEWTDRGGSCFEFNLRGTTSISSVNLGDGKDAIFATDSYGWGALAATWCVGSVQYGTDTEFYDGGISFCINPSWGQIDIQGVACHELGHQTGMNHVYESSATMYPYITGTGESARSIETGDMNCLKSIYGTCGGTGEYLLDLEASYGSGTLYMDFTIGTPEPCAFTTSLILTVPTVQVYELWAINIPAIDPPLFVPVELPVQLDGLGLLYLYSGLISSQGEEASQLLWGEF